MNTINTKALIEAYNNFVTKKVPFKLSNYYSVQSFIPHTLALFATVKLIRNDNNLISMTETMRNNQDNDIDRLVIFTGKANRSLLYYSKVKLSTHKAYTPLFMYAHKLYNDVEYTEWDKEDPAIEWALGRTLYRALEYARNNPNPNFSLERIKELRYNSMTYRAGKKAGITAPITDFKMHAYEDIPAEVMRMLLQTWILNAELRDDKAMILDIWDWDNIPAPLDSLPELDIWDHPIVASSECLDSDETLPWIY